ncbi:BMP family ABC transporter substrate-binding protein [Thiomicrorhabdus indica]|uniref:BMP family ABC transporter substrate-binding protein n=1 Tax=Thiomicrorhabdus indica TaxID=2267253 RepID=UPI002AA81484|nr:BMP family ABC transporter substrate-binding protein [Thiomicrorhabdus indica]
MFRRNLLKKTLIAALLSGVTMGVQAEDKTKVGFVYVGPVGDHGWSYQHDQGRLAVEKAFGDKVETSFVEKVSEGADAERVIRKLAASGHDIVFTTSFGYMNPTLKVAKQFPKVNFEHATGYKTSKNLGIYSARFYEGRYVMGQVAGKMTKSNVIGYIASFPIPEVVRGINATVQGLKSVNPDATVKVVWVNSWYDPGKEGDAAKALIDQGADIIMQHTDSPAPLQVAESRGVYAVGQATDMSNFAPKSHISAIIDDWSNYYIQKVKDTMDGTWKPEDTWGGIASGMVGIGEFADFVPKEYVSMAEKTISKIKSGELHPFKGPIKDQSGKEVVKEGEHLSDKDLLGMDWYVEGVEGKLPK